MVSFKVRSTPRTLHTKDINALSTVVGCVILYKVFTFCTNKFIYIYTFNSIFNKNMLVIIKSLFIRVSYNLIVEIT